MSISLGDLREAMDFLSAGVGIIGVCWPLGLAIADARDFARFPAHRATPTSPWVFFDRRLRRRLRRWFWIWPLLIVGCGAVVGVLTGLDGDRSLDTSGEFWWFSRYTFTQSARLAAQTAAYTASSMVLAVAVVFAFVFFDWKPAVAIPVTVVATVLFFAGIIALLHLPPPTTFQYRTFRPALGRHYLILAPALLPLAMAALARFYLLRGRREVLAKEEKTRAG